jgi:ribosomal protein S12 methylthiotransferase accessory factor YcaO
MTRIWDTQLQDLLGSLRAHFRVCEIDLPESPVFVAVAVPIVPETTGMRARLPAGRGLSAAQAMLSAAAESVELQASLARSCDREQNQFRLQDGLAHVLAQSISGGPPVFLPAQRIYLDWAAVFNEPLVYDADSNGCASGSNWSEALNRALLECIERDAMAIWWYGRQRRRHISISHLDRLAPRLSWWLSERQRRVRLIDITGDIGVPVVAAVSHDDNGRRIAIGSAAAKDFGAAAVLAVTEMIQMEVSMTMGSPNAELEDWLAKASVIDMIQFEPNRAVVENPSAAVDPLMQLKKAGHEIFAVCLTRREDLLQTAKVIVPTLSALHRTPNRERIISQSIKQPQFGGVQNVDEIETLEPY